MIYVAPSFWLIWTHKNSKMQSGLWQLDLKAGCSDGLQTLNKKVMMSLFLVILEASKIYRVLKKKEKGLENLKSLLYFIILQPQISKILGRNLARTKLWRGSKIIPGF